jgi:hypothetical protein
MTGSDDSAIKPPDSFAILEEFEHAATTEASSMAMGTKYDFPLTIKFGTIPTGISNVEITFSISFPARSVSRLPVL